MKYAILSDIHANLEALQTVLGRCKELGTESFVCLGDVVGYNADPKQCLDIVRALPNLSIVKGNHDEYASNNDDLMEGFNPNAKEAVLWTKKMLSAEDREWLSNLPMRQHIKGTSITIVHATLDEPGAWGYIFDSFRAMDNFTYQNTQLCFCGHSHVPLAFCRYPVIMKMDPPVDEIPGWAGGQEEDFSREETLELQIQPGYKYLINVGSVGQPRNRDPRASFAVYDTEKSILTRICLPYDFRTTQEKILAAGLPERNRVRLEQGS